MLTKVTIRNFKRFEDVEIELGNPVVFIGPNNSGKTTALQALALWDLGVRRLREKGESEVALNRRDLIGLPVPDARMLWRNLRVSSGPIHVLVEGVTKGLGWTTGIGFHYLDKESLRCRALDSISGIPPSAAIDRVVLLPPMLSPLMTTEALRNFCHQVTLAGNWDFLQARTSEIFGVDLDEPLLLPHGGKIQLTYRERAEEHLDISAAGRGLQHALLLLAFSALNLKSVLLIDEMDTHLESLLQRQIYQALNDIARDCGNQVILTSHSPVILNEAARRDMVVAFIGKPHRIDARGSQLLKSLKEIDFDHYYQAEQTGWVLYLEGSTDLAILRAFAEILSHPVRQALERPFVHYVENQPRKAQEHFYGLREAKPDLQGFALFDRLTLRIEERPHLEQRMWRRREIESYLCAPETLLRWAAMQGEQGGTDWSERMKESITRIEAALQTLGKGSPWSPETKVSDDFLDPLFESFFSSLNLPNLMRKTDYHTLARYVPPEMIDPEVGEVLDRILATCERAKPGEDL